MNEYQLKVTLLYTKWYLMPFFSLTTTLKNAVKVNNFHKYSEPEICKYDEKKRAEATDINFHVMEIQLTKTTMFKFHST